SPHHNGEQHRDGGERQKQPRGCSDAFPTLEAHIRREHVAEDRGAAQDDREPRVFRCTGPRGEEEHGNRSLVDIAKGAIPGSHGCSAAPAHVAKKSTGIAPLAISTSATGIAYFQPRIR